MNLHAGTKNVSTNSKFHNLFLSSSQISIFSKTPEMMMQDAVDVGILAMEIYIPKKYVDQTHLEVLHKVSTGKYTIGLGQSKMSFVDDREDICSISLTAVHNLLLKYNIPLDRIGRLEVGTETIIDKSKSVKSVLMQLFAESGNTDIEGADTTNACYGGTNALFNSINWIESSSWDGRFALCVAADIAVYKDGPARPTGGAGAVAMLIGPNAPLVFDRGMRVSHIEHVYDFYKPNLNSEYPEVDGMLSKKCYAKALDVCYNRYMDKLTHIIQRPAVVSDLDFVCFHAPYTKLVQKSFARLTFNDFKRDQLNPKYEEFMEFAEILPADTHVNAAIDAKFVKYSASSYIKKVSPSLLCPRNMGNIYCGSLYSGLISLLTTESSLVKNI